MAIILEPAKPEDHERVKCEHCKSTIGYLPIEIQTRNGKDYSGGPDGEDWVDCPGCSKKIILRSW